MIVAIFLILSRENVEGGKSYTFAGKNWWVNTGNFCLNNLSITNCNQKHYFRDKKTSQLVIFELEKSMILSFVLLQKVCGVFLIYTRMTMMMMMMMMMMMIMNCFRGMVDRRKAFSLISSRDHCQRFSPSQITETPQAGFEPVQNLSSGIIEWRCAVVITT